MVTYQDIANNDEINTYIKCADMSLISMGYTEHSFAHVVRTATTAHSILTQLGYDERTCELARIAGYMHDIGNVINREDHAQSGAVMAFRILDNLGMEASEVAQIIAAIGNHDEHTAFPVSPLTAALILADKCDVRRSRVRTKDKATFDIHDRVNFSVERADLSVNRSESTIMLELKIDTSVSHVSDYFEIFLTRMLLCRRASETLDCRFGFKINDIAMM